VDYEASMQLARSGLGVAVVNGKIYAIGGATSSGAQPNSAGVDVYAGSIHVVVTGTNEEYDPETDRWTYKSVMPTPRAVFAIGVYQNKIYCIGGKTGSIYTGAVEVYDPATDTWETRTAMPTARAFLRANVVNDKIYVMGGMKLDSDDPYPTLNEVYDPATDSWSTGEPMPFITLFGYASAVFGNKIYFNYDSAVYEAGTDSWSYFASPPSGVAFSAAASTTGMLASEQIYFFGKEDVGAYDPVNDSWSLGSRVPTLRYHFNVAVVNDTFYVIGGHTFYWMTGGYAPVAVNEVHTPFGYGIMSPPVVSVFSPKQNATYDTPDVSLTFYVDKMSAGFSYCLDAEANVTIVGNATLTSLANGVHNITIYAKDNFGKVGASETINFTIAEPEPFTAAFLTTLAIIVIVLSFGLLVYLKGNKHKTN
jgi:hypothetical protein